MKFLVLFAALLLPARAQFIPVTASRITRGAGAPTAGLCAAANDVGKAYINRTAAAAASSLYVCANTAASTYAWELSAGGASIASTTSALKGNGAGGASAVTGTATDCVLVNGSSGSCGTAGGPQYDLVKTSATVATLGGVSCVASPCVTTQNNVVLLSRTTAVTCTLSGTSNNGTLYFYITSGGVLTCGHNTTTTVTGSAGITVATSISGFPADVCPLWAETWVANVLDAIVTSSMFKGNCYNMNIVSPGTGLTCSTDPTTGVKTCSLTSTSGTDRQSFQLGGYVGGGASAAPIFGSAGTSIYQGTTITGPNSISYQLPGILLNAANDSIMAAKKTSSTWSGAAGTVDVNVLMGTIDGAPNMSTSWVVTFYIGCNTNGGAFTYGTGTQVTATPPSANGNFKLFSATGLNLPGSCAADSTMEFFMQRNADTPSTTGVRMFAEIMETVIRGN